MQRSTIWQVKALATPDIPARGSSGPVPLKWANDKRTGEPRYIHDSEVIVGTAECQCPACNLALTPVLAGQPRRRNPTAHFRHPKGAQKDECTVVAARLAVIRQLQDDGFIDLPKRRMSVTATGFSGEGYEGWVELPEQRAFIASSSLQDHATAILTLEDGRELLVDLSGRSDVHGQSGQAVITLNASDPAIAAMTPEEIRARLRLTPEIYWHAHWDDQNLKRAASQRARQLALDALDEWSEADEFVFKQHLPDGIDISATQKLRRETLLHWEVKAILARTSKILTPSLEVEVTRYAPDEFRGDWDDNTLRAVWVTAEADLALKSAQLETRLGDIIPDVICNLREPLPFIHGGIEVWLDGAFEELVESPFSTIRWPANLLIEVTVTHGIDQEKLLRIQEINLPTIEIDIGSLGGRVTREGLRNLVIHETIGKRWIHHPAWGMGRKKIDEHLDGHPVTLGFKERLAELRRPQILAKALSEWISQYLAAAMDFHDTNTRLDKVIRAYKGTGPTPKLLGQDSEQWLKLIEAADALAIHGYPGAADREMVGNAGIIPRLLSIQHNRGVGYAFDTGYQVVSAIMQSGPGYQQWHTLYTIAVKAYGLDTKFTQKQSDRYVAWRQNIIDKVEAADETHLRPIRYDAVLSVLFPEMAPRLANGYGRSQNQP